MYIYVYCWEGRLIKLEILVYLRAYPSARAQAAQLLELGCVCVLVPPLRGDLSSISSSSCVAVLPARNHAVSTNVDKSASIVTHRTSAGPQCLLCGDGGWMCVRACVVHIFVVG